MQDYINNLPCNQIVASTIKLHKALLYVKLIIQDNKQDRNVCHTSTLVSEINIYIRNTILGKFYFTCTRYVWYNTKKNMINVMTRTSRFYPAYKR